jgi:hypothetical protein
VSQQHVPQEQMDKVQVILLSRNLRTQVEKLSIDGEEVE